MTLQVLRLDKGVVTVHFMGAVLTILMVGFLVYVVSWAWHRGKL